MALPSQQARSGMSVARFSGGRSRRRGPRRVLALAGIAGVIALGVWAWGGAGTGENEPAIDHTPRAEGRTAESPERPNGAASSGSVNELVMVRSERPPERVDPEPPTNLTAARPEPRPEPSAPEVALNTRTPEPPARRVEPAPKAEPIAEPDADAFGLTARTLAALADAQEAVARNAPVEARDVLNRALHNQRASLADAAELRTRLTELSKTLTFSPRVFPGDVTADSYVVSRGDALSRIPRKEGFAVDYRLIQIVNEIDNPNRIRPGQSLKILYGPFHAVVDKSDYRLDLYAEQTDTAGNRIFIRSFPVGLGEYGSTPVGSWVVDSRAVNPAWANPRTGEQFGRDDADNPIGERWIGLKGTDANTEIMDGYGIHGTIEPESIGQDASMGCVRLLAGDVELLHALLVEERSTVLIVE